MGSYQVRWKQTARKELRHLPRKDISSLVAAADKLAFQPLPPGVRKLSGEEHTFRIRVGDYRLVYTIASDVLIIEIIRVGHRKDVYR